MRENLLQIPLFDQFRNQIGNFCITLYIQSLVWLWDSMMDLVKFKRIFVSNEHIQKIVSCMLNFARSIIESHNHNQTNDWMYNVMQKLPIWLQNWSKSGICKRFFPHLGLKVLNHDPNFLYFNTYLRKIYFPKIFRISGIPCISFQMPTYIFEKKSFIDLKQKKI